MLIKVSWSVLFLEVPGTRAEERNPKCGLPGFLSPGGKAWVYYGNFSISKFPGTNQNFRELFCVTGCGRTR
jgi:hypothetical protein